VTQILLEFASLFGYTELSSKLLDIHNQSTGKGPGDFVDGSGTTNEGAQNRAPRRIGQRRENTIVCDNQPFRLNIEVVSPGSSSRQPNINSDWTGSGSAHMVWSNNTTHHT
jgi:hypothetical protein